MSKEQHVVGLTGLTNAGKGEIARILHESHGFETVSLSRVLREVAEENYGSYDRRTLETVYRELGEENLAQKLILLARMSEKDKMVIDSIRSIRLFNVIEEAFEPNLYFVGVAAPRKERYRRLQERAKLGDPMSWDEFIQLDLIQLGDVTSDLLGYQVRQCFSRVNIIVRNNSRSLADLELKVANFLNILGIE